MSTALQFLWLVLVTLTAGYLGLVASLNLAVDRLPDAWLRAVSDARLGFLTLSGALLTHAAIAAWVAVTWSLGLAIGVVALAGLLPGLFAYFLRQRFAGPPDQPEMVRKHPGRLPLANVWLAASAAVWLGLECGVYWAALPVLVWLVLGFITTEMAIHGWITLSNGRADRSKAIIAVNEAQGRSVLRWDRYPFP